MLVIRMQRTGRKGHAMFRVVVQDSRRTPTSGKIVAQLGSYDPHAKVTTLNKERAQHYLDHGAQPSDRVAKLLKAEGVKLPAWVNLAAGKDRTVRNPDKRRSTHPEEPAAEEAPAAEAETAAEPVESEAQNEPEAAEATPAETETPAPEAAETDTAEAEAAETEPETETAEADSASNDKAV